MSTNIRHNTTERESFNGAPCEFCRLTTQECEYIIVNNLGGAIVPPSMFEPAFTGGGPPVNTSSLWIVKHDIEEELRMKKKKLAALLLAGAMFAQAILELCGA